MSQAVSLRKLIGVSLDASPLGATVIVPPFEVVWFGYCYWSVRSTASCESSLMLIRSCLRPRSNIVRGVRATDARRENRLGAHKTSGGEADAQVSAAILKCVKFVIFVTHP
jgi:hypothetical protein